MSSKELFCRVPEIKKHYYNKEEVSHRRVNSTNLEMVQGLKSKAGHRRTYSNTALDFTKLFQVEPSPRCEGVAEIEEKKEPMTPDSLTSASVIQLLPAPKKKTFVGLLDAALTYFASDHTPMPVKKDMKYEAMIKRLEEAERESNEFKLERVKLQEEINKLLSSNQQSERKIQKLRDQKFELEKSLKKVTEKLRDEQIRTQELEARASNNRPSRIFENKKPIIVKQISKASPTQVSHEKSNSHSFYTGSRTKW